MNSLTTTRFVGARCRPNTVLASGFDLLVFFTFVSKDPALVTTADVLDFIADQRAPRRGANVVRLDDREVGLSARTVRRRLATLSGLYGYLYSWLSGASRRPSPGRSAAPVRSRLSPNSPKPGSYRRDQWTTRTRRGPPVSRRPNLLRQRSGRAIGARPSRSASLRRSARGTTVGRSSRTRQGQPGTMRTLVALGTCLGIRYGRGI